MDKNVKKNQSESRINEAQYLASCWAEAILSFTIYQLINLATINYTGTSVIENRDQGSRLSDRRVFHEILSLPLAKRKFVDESRDHPKRIRRGPSSVLIDICNNVYALSSFLTKHLVESILNLRKEAVYSNRNPDYLLFDDVVRFLLENRVAVELREQLNAKNIPMRFKELAIQTIQKIDKIIKENLPVKVIAKKSVHELIELGVIISPHELNMLMIDLIEDAAKEMESQQTKLQAQAANAHEIDEDSDDFSDDEEYNVDASTSKKTT